MPEVQELSVGDQVRLSIDGESIEGFVIGTDPLIFQLDRFYRFKGIGCETWPSDVTGKKAKN